MAESKRILVVDDEEDVRELLRRILEGAGYDVIHASDGAEALGKIYLDPPDLVLLDIMMPGLDGWQVLAAMRRLPQRPPVVVVSAVRTGEARALEEGAAAFLAKPFRFTVLLEACKRALPAAATGP